MKKQLTKRLQDAVNKVNVERVQEDEKRQKELEEVLESDSETYLFHYNRNATDKQLQELFEEIYDIALDHEKFVLADNQMKIFLR